jgi:DNA excision repair protein ERCC-2
MKLQETFENYEEDFETDVLDKKEKAYDDSAKSLANWNKEALLNQGTLLNNDTVNPAFSKLLFPYDSIRNSQKELIEDISESVNAGKSIIAHAPTGLGKTVASIGPALEYCIRNKKTLFFLTSRNTQHIMAVKTLRDIRKKYDIKINVLDIIGKKGMCLQPGIEAINGNDFAEFCKNARKTRTCEFYNNTRNKEGQLKIEGDLLLEELKGTIQHTEELVHSCEQTRVCPYEIALAKAETAQVVIADYYYIFHPDIQQLFFRKVGLSLANCVVIVDEAHNLPERVKNLATSNISSFVLERALAETVKYGFDEASAIIRKITEGLLSLESGVSERIEGESSRLVSKEEFIAILDKIMPFKEMNSILENAGEVIQEKQKRSYVNSIVRFIVNWQGDNEGFTRIFTSSGIKKKLTYECLDPSLISKPTFDAIYSSIIISGTLEPTEMYRDLLGIDKCVLKSYKNPFPTENALGLIVPLTTTKYDRRDASEFNRIAVECGKILDTVPGNCALFFPSYDIRDRIYRYLVDITDKELILEKASDSKEEKAGVIKNLTRPSLSGKVLLGTSSGSFGEGIDIPGNFLSCVVVVGLPLKKPTLEVQELIKYFDKKLGKGWDYCYFYPSFNKTFQNVGRCIRSETDRGILIFLDERFAEKRYLRFFGDRQYVITYDYVTKIKNFNQRK